MKRHLGFLSMWCGLALLLASVTGHAGHGTRSVGSFVAALCLLGAPKVIADYRRHVRQDELDGRLRRAGRALRSAPQHGAWAGGDGSTTPRQGRPIGRSGTRKPGATGAVSCPPARNR